MGITSREIYRVVFKDYPDVLDVKQVSNLLDVCDKTVYKLIADGSLPALRVGRQHRITKVNVMKYMKVLACSDIIEK